MKLNKITIASIASRLGKFLKYKKIKTVRSWEIVNFLTTDEIVKEAKKISYHPKMEQHIGNIYSVLSNLYESGSINIDTIVALMMDYYIRTGKPMNYNTSFSLNELKERLRFLSVLSVNEQFDFLDGLQRKFNEQQTFKKFTGDKETLFGVNESQVNKLYELVKTGKISNLLFAFFWKNSKFSIDETKIIDLDYLKFVRIMKYVIEKDITTEKIKYEV